MQSLDQKLIAAALAATVLATGVGAARADDAAAKSQDSAQAAAAKESAAPNTLTEQEKKAGFKLLFDGKNPGEHFRSYKKDELSKGWQAKDGALVRAAGGAGDIVTKDQHEAFELLIDYKIAKGGNSGIMFHVTEQADTPWMTGPEIQIQDNVAGHDPQKSGWLYQLYKPDTDATKPAGEWNSMRIVIAPKGQKSAVYMNGQKYYEFEKGSEDWDQKVAKSKFAKMPNFGKPTKGHISLQDHGDEVAYRNIKIRALDGTSAGAAK